MINEYHANICFWLVILVQCWFWRICVDRHLGDRSCAEENYNKPVLFASMNTYCFDLIVGNYLQGQLHDEISSHIPCVNGTAVPVAAWVPDVACADILSHLLQQLWFSAPLIPIIHLSTHPSCRITPDHTCPTCSLAKRVICRCCDPSD